MPGPGGLSPEPGAPKSGSTFPGSLIDNTAGRSHLTVTKEWLTEDERPVHYHQRTRGQAHRGTREGRRERGDFRAASKAALFWVQYRFELDKGAAPGDMLIERDGATVAIDPISAGFVTGSELDFVDELIGAQFTIHNPNATASCGCGTSFSI